MNRRLAVAGVCLGLLAPLPARAQEHPREAVLLERVDLRDVPLEEACRLLADQTGLNLVPSADAAHERVSLYLTDVAPLAAIEALCRAHELWFQRDPSSGIVRLSTAREYTRGLGQLEKTEYFTLLYPNALEVGYAISNLYGARVVLGTSDGDRETLADLALRLSRFDLIASRTQGLGTQATGTATNHGTTPQGGGDPTLAAGLLGSDRPRTPPPQAAPVDRTPLRAGEILDLDRQAARGEAAREDAASRVAAQHHAPIHVTIARRQNKLVVRTGDEDALAQIRTLVRKLDVPTPLVLLEVRVLSVDLADGMSSFFEYQLAEGRTSGSLLEQVGNNVVNPVAPALGPAGVGLRPGDLIFQVIEKNFSARLQLLQQKNRIKTLATPFLLTANNEVSRLFVGREVPLNRSFAGGQVVANQTSSITTPGTTGIEFRPVGTTLLITPNINADRTVTLRIVEESSSVSSTETVLVPTGTGFAPQVLNVVTSQSVSGTIVAKSDLSVAFGGLIETGTTVEREQIPILGDIPLLGLLFRRRHVERETRREVVIVVRPYVLSTPAEAEAVSQRLVDRLGSDTHKLDLRVSPEDGAAPGIAPGTGFRFHGLDREE